MSYAITDWFIVQRLLRRKLTFWRVFACISVFLIFIVGSWRLAESMGGLGHHIARVELSGVIKDEHDMIQLLEKIEKAPAVSAVLFTIQSPGGGTAGSESLYLALRRLSLKKPVIAVVGSMAASGGYIAALGADRIIAQGNSVVGSIGVLFQAPDISKLMQFVGVRMEEIKSSPLKASPNGLEPMSPEVRSAISSMVADTFSWFKALVKERRNLSDAQLAIVSDGRVFTGRQALDYKLVDEIGGESEAVAWLEANKKLPPHTPVRDWKPDHDLDGFNVFGTAAYWAQFLGWQDIARVLRLWASEKTSEEVGLMSLWRFPEGS